MKLNITDKIFILTSLIMSLSISALTIHAEVPTPSKDQKNGMWGYVDKQGKWVVKPKYQEVSEYKVLPGGLKAAFVVNKDKCGYIDEKGKGIGEGISFSSIDSISPKAALVRKNDKYGVVDWGMKYILKPVFEDVKNVDGKWFIATQKKRKGVFSNEGQIVLNPEYDEITVGSPIWLKTAKNGSYGYFDMQSGKELVEPIYRDVKEMFEIDGLGYIPFCSSLNNWGLYGREGRVVLDSKYSEIEPVPASHVIALTELAGGYKLYYPERNMFFDYTPGLKWKVGGYTLREGKVKSGSRDLEYARIFDNLFPGGNFSTVTDPDGNLVSRYEKPCVRELKDKNIYMVQTDKSKYDVYD
ncbi:MAG: WG repeat-containing protein, partial [Muribaculaceae bacterium]|nr:WG repeat-containing protein [Muribaculaceae bacterium]